MASKLYYDPAKPSGFATLKKLQEAARQQAWKEFGRTFIMVINARYVHIT